MKQKYLANGIIEVEFTYKGEYHKREFKNMEELKSFLCSL